MATRVPREDEIARRWLVVDADGRTLGRLATFVAVRLRGKHRPTFTPHMDTGDHVIVVNAARVRLTGQKESTKVYISHSGQPGGLREVPFRRLHRSRPEQVIRMAVSGMLPKNRLGRRMIRRLKVYPGAEHPHQAQTPAPADMPGRS